jgi:hypothetical protein
VVRAISILIEANDERNLQTRREENGRIPPPRFLGHVGVDL